MCCFNNAKNIFKKLRFEFIEKDYERRNYWSKGFFLKYSYEKLSRKKSVLDLGCGAGNFLKLGDNRIFGIDTNYKSLKEARRYSINLVQGNVLQLPFATASFDGINCSHIIEHFNPDDAYQLLCEMNRVLKIDGLLVLSTPLLWKGFFYDFTHIKPYSPEAIMHYYGEKRHETTKPSIDCTYDIDEIKWRYAKIPLESLLFPRGGILNTLMMFSTQWLNYIGFGKYVKTGYTMALIKIR